MVTNKERILQKESGNVIRTYVLGGLPRILPVATHGYCASLLYREMFSVPSPPNLLGEQTCCQLTTQ